MRDSAGVEIVESPACLAASGSAPRVEEAPTLRIGAGEYSGPYRFFRVTDALRYPDGRIAVADRWTRQIHVFSSGGDHLRTAGGIGDAPGEFQALERIREVDGALIAADPVGARVTVYDAGGMLQSVETLPIPAITRPGETPLPERPGAPRRQLDDVLLLDGDELLVVRVRRPALGVPGLQQDTVFIYSESDVERPLLSVPGSWHEAVPHVPLSGLRPQPYSPVSSWTTDGARVYYSTGDRFEVRVADGSGRLLRIFRSAEQPRPVTGADREAWKRAMLGDSRPEDVPLLVEDLNARTFPPRMPAYTELRAAVDGGVWARRYDDDRRWDVYDPSGVCLGTLPMPPTLTHVFEIGADYLLGRAQEHADFEYVQMHRLLER